MKQRKKISKAIFKSHVNLHSFNEGDIVLAYDITHKTLSYGKFESLWNDPLIIQYCLTKGAYIGLSRRLPFQGSHQQVVLEEVLFLIISPLP
jgi:hypothetical protein